MKDKLIEKLKKALIQPIKNECQVVYIMVEIRKFIERTREISEQWENLKYWCDWVMHTRLDKKLANETLTAMESYIIKNPGSKFHHSYFNEQFISLEGLRWELYSFLKNNKLPTKIINIPPWDDFSKFLVETLRDCPLEKDGGLVRKFFFSKKDHISEAEKYSIDWELIFDGSRPNLYGSVLRFLEKRNKK